MRRVHPRNCALIFAVVLGLLLAGRAPTRAQEQGRESATPRPVTSQASPLDALLDALGNEQYTTREQATRDIIALGAGVVPQLQARLEHEPDPEIRHRLRYILENIVPPQRAVLVVRADAAAGLHSGELITHVNAQRVRSAAELQRRLRRTTDLGVEALTDPVLRVRGVHGSREVGPVSELGLTTVSDYIAPRGEVIADALRLYADGFAERADELLTGMGGPIPENEMSGLLRARIAYTAGDGARAFQLLAGQLDAAGPAQLGNPWRSPSALDLAGPGRAPLHLEWALLTRAGATSYETPGDPDIRMQRVLVPARRFRDALHDSASHWWSRYRDRLGLGTDDNRKAGNMLAVAAWMLFKLDLQSECARLIRPRSEILGYTWIRVQTDAWLAFLAGQTREALDGFYADARRVLQRPLPETDGRVITRNPRVAAMLALFLYQFPDDPRVQEIRELVNYPGHAGLAAYADWMLHALCARNNDVIRRDLLAMLPNLSDADVTRLARAAALLEYVQNVPDDGVLATARQRVTQVDESAGQGTVPATIDTLRHLAAGRAADAREALAPFADKPELAALRHTVEFLCDPPPTASDHAALSAARGGPLLAVPIGRSGNQWLVLTRDRRLLRFDAEQSLLTPLEKPTPSWFPGPLNWPWIGREESTGRVWVYGRGRVLEAARDQKPALRLNIRTRDIPAFDRYVTLVFSALAEAVAAAPLEPGENGAFLRCEIQDNDEYTADPDLPEIGFIRPVPEDLRMVHLAMRGGPHLLIDVATRRAWSSLWMAEQLGLDSPPSFFAQALRPADGEARDEPPVVMLMSDRGLIRFDVADETLTRLALPGSEPFPPVIPESAPYVRRDPRYVYCARLPADGGQVYRLVLADNRAEAVDMVNQVLPAGYCDVLSRAALRAQIDERFRGVGMPGLDGFVEDAVQAVARWRQPERP